MSSDANCSEKQRREDDAHADGDDHIEDDGQREAREEHGNVGSRSDAHDVNEVRSVAHVPGDEEEQSGQGCHRHIGDEWRSDDDGKGAP